MKRPILYRQIPGTFSPQYKYTLANLNLRQDKSVDSPILTVVPAGSKVFVMDAYEDWYEVIYDFLFGYLYTDYLSKTKFTWREATLHPFATSETNPIAVLPPQTLVEVISVVGDWSEVIYDEKVGYIFNDFLSDDGSPPATYDFQYFNTDMLRFVNENDIKSPTANLITTNLERRLTYIFSKGSDGLWQQLFEWPCTVGKPSTPTITGTYYVSGRKPYFGSEDYRVKFATRIRGSYYYHSVLFNAEGTEITDDRLGEALSHGCVRLAVENAQWIYDNVLDTTAIVIN